MRSNWIGTIDELESIEAWFGTDDPEELAARYDDSLRALESEDVETWLAEGARANVSTDAMAHFRADWLDGTEIPGVDGGTIESTLKDGFTAAITDARTSGLKLSILWVMLGSGPGAFSIDHLVGKNAVTVVISVPTETTAAANAQVMPDASAS
jgi:hypothetical protein